jgi:hypothetical protein
MLVSVVIPCHNAEAWIAETLDSVLTQRGVELDLVVVDDGSTDRSMEITRQVAGDRARVVSQAQSGVSRARNVGTGAARADYLQYLDADDVLMPGTLRARVAALEAGADVAYCNWVRWELQSDGTYLGATPTRRVLGRRPDIDLLAGSWWPPGALLYRRRIVEHIGLWREDFPLIEDARFQLDAALHQASFVHVDEVGLKYRVHGTTSLSRRDPNLFVECCYRNGVQLQEQWEQQGTLDAERRRTLASVFAHVAGGLFAHRPELFADAVSRVMDLDPGFVPQGSPLKRILARLVGYAAEERFAGWFREVKRVAAFRRA